ncbi:MAG: chemotaxis protein CheW [Planctomycetota bacterium]|nr:chemotaxis protein CheW [Planctomycetota bacterium]
MSEMDEALVEFLIECQENLSRMDLELLELEKSTDPELVKSIFRVMHTIKGSAGFLGLSKLEKLTHAAENLLSKIRDGSLQPTTAITSALLAAIDGTRAILSSLESNQNEGNSDSEAIIKVLNDCTKAPAASVGKAPAIVEETAVPVASSANVEMDEALKEFLIECQENLSRMDLELLQLEKSTHPELVKSIFRVMHTIKGSAGFLGLAKLEKLTHAAENLLSKIRDGSLQPTALITSALLAAIDGTRAILSSLESNQNEGTSDSEAIIKALNDCTKAPAVSVGNAPAAKTSAPEIKPNPAPVIAPTMVFPKDAGNSFSDALKPATPVTSVMEKAPDTVSAMKEKIEEPQREMASALSDSSVRIPVDVLDKLMSLASELVLSRNQLLQCSTRLNDSLLQVASRQFNLVTSELQEALMKTRMQPISNVWNKFPRMVREVAFKLGKQINLQMQGAETELDKTLIEAIKDPLTHLVRNSIDHGIESPDGRARANKKPEGTLLLRAYHESGRVNVVISDDGKGIDLNRVKAKALEKQLLSSDQLSQMGDNSVLQLIFLPGFSTAEKITSVSGRGVGMDVVKNNIEKIGGMIDIQSEVNKGTTIHLRIPLTLAIIKALSITAAGQSFTIPQTHITELLRIKDDSKIGGIEFVHETPVFRFRGKLIPLINLAELLQIKGKSETQSQPNHLVILQAEDRQFGLLVDSVKDTNEIVVKPLPSRLKGVGCFAGVTIMGDGLVQLILDVSGVARLGRVLPKIRDLGIKDLSAQDEIKADNQSAGEGLLLVSAGGESQIAIPLEQVVRLEEFRPHQLEKTGEMHLVQYREGIMPIYNLGNILGIKGSVETRDKTKKIQVVVHKYAGKYVGLVVEKILDTVYESIKINGDSTGQGIKKTGVVSGKITEFVDLGVLLALTVKKLEVVS